LTQSYINDIIVFMYKYEIVYFESEEGEKPFYDFFRGLKDTKTKARIISRLNRLESGNFGDLKKLKRIYELRLFFGPGYRIYFGIEDDKLIVLLTGGDKSSQKKDIINAQRYWDEYTK
jgi:putative addiction module killer protein